MLQLGQDHNQNPLASDPLQGLLLTKGDKFSLTKDNPNMDNLHIILGWDANEEENGFEFDLDAMVFMIGANGKVEDPKNFIYFRQLLSPCGSIEHGGDNLKGGGGGELVKVSLKKVPTHIQKIAFAVCIYDAGNRGKQNFGQVRNAFIQIIDEDAKRPLGRFDLTEDYSFATAVVAGELYRHNGEWRFNAAGVGHKLEIEGLVRKFFGLA